jgi:anti-sigma B factor antagonist
VAESGRRLSSRVRRDTLSGVTESIVLQIVEGDPVVVRVAGRVLFDTLRPLADALAAVDPAAHPRLVLELGDVPMCDSSALNLFVRAHAARHAAGGWLRLVGPQPLVERVLDITNLARVLPVFASAQEAAAAP